MADRPGLGGRCRRGRRRPGGELSQRLDRRLDTITCTDRGLDNCPDGDTLRTLSLVLPGLLFLLGLAGAVLTARRSRWVFSVACGLMVVGPAAVLLLMAALEP